MINLPALHKVIDSSCTTRFTMRRAVEGFKFFGFRLFHKYESCIWGGLVEASGQTVRYKQTYPSQENFQSVYDAFGLDGTIRLNSKQAMAIGQSLQRPVLIFISSDCSIHNALVVINDNNPVLQSRRYALKNAITTIAQFEVSGTLAKGTLS